MITSLEQNTGSDHFIFVFNFLGLQNTAILQILLNPLVLKWVMMATAGRFLERSIQHVRNVFKLCYLPKGKLYLFNCCKVSGHCQQMVYYFCIVLVFPQEKHSYSSSQRCVYSYRDFNIPRTAYISFLQALCILLVSYSS